MTLERLVKAPHVPPFLVDCDDAFSVAALVCDMFMIGPSNMSTIRFFPSTCGKTPSWSL